MAEANEIFYDEKTGQVVEFVKQPVNPDNFQTDLDAAQNAVNEAQSAVDASITALNDAQENVDVTEANLEDAKELLAFQEGRKAAYDAALATSSAATTAGETADTEVLAASPEPGEAVDVPITLATE